MNLYTYSGIYLADNQKLLIPTVNCNGLFAISKANQSQYLGIFNEASHPLAWMIVASHQIDREIYFFSFYQFCFWKFNLDTKKMEFVEYYKCDESFLVTNVELVNNQFWIFSNITTIPILIYDCYTGKVSNLSWDCITDHEGFSITKSVVYENKIFFATRKINNVQLAIVDARDTGTGLTTDMPLRIDALRYADVFGTTRQNAYMRMKEAEETLFNRRFSFFDEDGKLVKSRWISQVKYLDNEGAIEIVFTPAVVQGISRINGVKEFFTQYLLSQTAQLKSVYSSRLYELLIQWRSTGKRRHDALRLPEGSWLRQSGSRRRVQRCDSR